MSRSLSLGGVVWGNTLLIEVFEWTSGGSRHKMLGMCGREEMILHLTLWVEALGLGEVVDVVDCQRKVSNIDKDANSHER